MPRPRRDTRAGYAYHVLNRANGRANIFETDGDYCAFEDVLATAIARFEMGVAVYCLMPNHWHLVALPTIDDQLPKFMAWLTMTHTQRWHAYRGTAGTGHLYQGRYKSFPIQRDRHFLDVCRYVERNALSAHLVERAMAWPWSSLSRRSNGTAGQLCEWPVPRPANWPELVDRPSTQKERATFQRCVRRGAPYGEAFWAAATASALGLSSALRARGAPRGNRNRSKRRGNKGS